MFFPSSESYHQLRLVTDRVDRVFWDNENLNEFVLINGTNAFSYIISKNNIFSHVVTPVIEILSIEKLKNEEG